MHVGGGGVFLRDSGREFKELGTVARELPDNNCLRGMTKWE